MIRLLDIIISFVGLLFFFPIFIIISIWVKIDSKGPIFFKQIRVGQNNIDFKLYKFRSMYLKSDKKTLITIGENDLRITKSGHYIRKLKIDELPQLFNVLKGDMSIVGPRPEVRKYVDYYSPEQLKILSIKPGITDYASIEYMDENYILGKAENPNKLYVEQIMQDKLNLNLKYLEKQSVYEYFKIILLTIKYLFKKNKLEI